MENKKLTYVVGGVVLVALLGVGYYFLGPQAKDRIVVTNNVEKIVNKDLEFSFSYESGETALSSIESTPGQFGNSELLKMYALMESKTLDEFNKAKESGEVVESPPAISVLVFTRSTSTDQVEDSSATTSTSTSTSTSTATSSSSITKVRQWAEANSAYTSINLAQGEIQEIKVDGASALHYKADGLYTQDVYVVKYGKRMYVFVGQYLEEGDYMYKSFQALKDSILFE